MLLHECSSLWFERASILLIIVINYSSYYFYHYHFIIITLLLFMVFMVCCGFGQRCNSGRCMSGRCMSGRCMSGRCMLICYVVLDALSYNNPNSIEGASDTMKNTIFKWIRTSPIRPRENALGCWATARFEFSDFLRHYALDHHKN